MILLSHKIHIESYIKRIQINNYDYKVIDRSNYFKLLRIKKLIQNNFPLSPSFSKGILENGKNTKPTWTFLLSPSLPIFLDTKNNIDTDDSHSETNPIESIPPGWGQAASTPSDPR